MTTESRPRITNGQVAPTDGLRGGPVHLEVGEAHSDDDDAGAEPSAFFERFAELDYRTPAYAATLLRHVLGALCEQDNVIVDAGGRYERRIRRYLQSRHRAAAGLP